MAGSNYLTTYYAKRIIGDAAAADASSALLQTGDDITANTWIISRTNRATDYGIKYTYDATNGDKIEFHGGSPSTVKAWVMLDNGDVYILGHVGIGDTPEANGHQLYVYGTTKLLGNVGIGDDADLTNKLNVVGASYFDGNVTHNGIVYFANGTTYYIDNSAETYLGETRVDYLTINANHQTNYRLYVEGNTYTNGTIQASNNITAGIEGSDGSTAQRAVVAATTGGRIVMYIDPNDSNGARSCGLWVNAHGTGSNKSVVYIDTNNNATFNGNANTADKWKTARTLTIGNTGKSVDGSANVSWSKDEILGGSGTTQFLRADKTWTNALTGAFYSTGSPGFQNETTAGTWAYLRLKSGTSGWDIAVSSSSNDGALDFRPHTSTNKGIMISQNGDLYFNNNATNGIYYKGTKATYRMIRFIDNTGDNYGNGISIGGGGLTVIGAGESSDTLLSSLSLTTAGGTETMYIGSDGNIELYPGQNSYDASAHHTISASGFWAGVDGNTTREIDSGVRSGAGSLYLWSAAATAGDRGLWLPAHGTGGAYALICSSTNNISYMQAHRLGIRNTDGASGYGLSLYNGQYNGVPEYGVFFGQTATFGKFGDVSNDWATYFTMNRNDTRGWIFKSNGTTKDANNNYASISGRGHFTGTLSPSSWIDGQHYMNAAYNIADYSNTGSYNPWIRATNTWSSGESNAKVGRWFSFGTLGTSFYWIGSTTTRTANSYDYGMTYNISNGVLTATRMDCTWLRVIHNSSNNSDDAMVYLENKSSNDWAMKINCTDNNYGIDITTSGNAAYALRANGRITGSALYAAYNTYPSIRCTRTDAGEASIYIENNTAGWALGVAPWSVGAGVFAIGQYSGTGSSAWRFKIDNNGYCFCRSYLNIGGHEKNASSPTYVWGSNSSDNYLRSYQTSKLSVATAATATTATHADHLAPNTSTTTSDPGGLTWLNGDMAAAAGLNANDGPTKAWWYILRNRHTNTSNNYYTDVAIPFNANSIYYKIVRNNSVVNSAWCCVLDSWNYTSYTVTKTGSGASGTWGIHITGNADGSSASCTGNAATATKLQTARAINGTNFDGSGAITTANWGTSRTLTVGGTGKSVNGSGNVSWSKAEILGSSTNAYFYRGDQTWSNTINGTFTATTVKGAVWNDYAECRMTETEEPGRCVTETHSGRMRKTFERLMPGCKIISDTYGTLIGETDTAKTPIAVAGRVLVYPYRSRTEYNLGDAVCSAPNGTIDVMTRDEIMMYPERIVGTVSEIPNYAIWYGGSKESPTPIEVKGRIWIYIK